jgi:hypothetical protein
MTELDDDTRLKLLGIRALAENHNRHLEDLKRVARELLGVTTETDPADWVGDYVYGEATIESVLEGLEHSQKRAAL